MENIQHLPVFHSMSSRRDTDVATGLIDAKQALRTYGPQAVEFHSSSVPSLRLGPERPVYEVTFREHIYRMLCRPTSQASNDAYGFIRSRAPGLTSDGILLPAPVSVPNTPLSLMRELEIQTGAISNELAAEAYDILGYREKNRSSYPDGFTPKGYSLGERLLLEWGSADGTMRSLYDTPARVNPDLWSVFLWALDADLGQRLVDYAFSSVSHRELGSAGCAAMVVALKIRLGHGIRPLTSSQQSLLQIVPRAEEILRRGRTVGTRPLFSI